MSFPKIIGHRGIPHIAPENTIVSFKKALESGADGLETDVQMTKDGHIILCHDETLNRTTNGKGLLKDYTLKELKNLSAGAYFSEEFKEEKIPTLEEFFELVWDKNILINIEIKSGIVIYDGIEEKLISMINKLNIGHKIIISSFNHYSLLKCKEIDKNIKTGVLYAAGLVAPWEYAKRINADAIHPFYYSIRPDMIPSLKNNKIMVNPYTVDDETHMRYMINMGVDGIITNYADKLYKMKLEDLK